MLGGWLRLGLWRCRERHGCIGLIGFQGLVELQVFLLVLAAHGPFDFLALFLHHGIAQALKLFLERPGVEIHRCGSPPHQHTENEHPGSHEKNQQVASPGNPALRGSGLGQNVFPLRWLMLKLNA